MKEMGARFGVKFWAYCLMDNHVHLVAVPPTEAALADCIGEIHRRYTIHVNRREGWTGCLWQGRFFSAPVETAGVAAVIRYVERNPIRARLAPRAEDYPWSSARSHVRATLCAPLDRSPLQEEIGDWAAFLASEEAVASLASIRHETRTGRPLGGVDFVRRIEAVTGRTIERRPPGRPRKNPGKNPGHKTNFRTQS